MAPFFAFGSIVASLLFGLSLVLGYLGSESHLMVALTAALLTISAHCLVFGIFTGAGKDTRELVQDLSLNPEYVGQTKSFRKLTFPPALYSIFLVMLTAILGGSLSARAGVGWRWAHQGLAWISFLYNLKTFLLEYRCIRQNAEILKRVNQEAAKVTTAHPELVVPETFTEENVDGLGGYEWGTHVYALGKFLVFLGYNTWLPYLYMRYIMLMLRLPIWPFVLVSVVFLVAGYAIRWRYRKFQPDFGAKLNPASH